MIVFFKNQHTHLWRKGMPTINMFSLQQTKHGCSEKGDVGNSLRPALALERKRIIPCLLVHIHIFIYIYIQIVTDFQYPIPDMEVYP